MQNLKRNICVFEHNYVTNSFYGKEVKNEYFYCRIYRSSWNGSTGSKHVGAQTVVIPATLVMGTYMQYHFYWDSWFICLIQCSFLLIQFYLTISWWLYVQVIWILLKFSFWFFIHNNEGTTRSTVRLSPR